MSNFVISLLIAAGSGTWIFTKFQNRSGNNTQQSLTAAGVAALILFIVLIVVINMIT
ncbi:MAG TPA: hypothetical protein VG964_04010 [Candidatus Saccharimonadales bacterium]|nr:hypothetical protein [Candidatus Saccharimonadales bacterium]